MKHFRLPIHLRGYEKVNQKDCESVHLQHFHCLLREQIKILNQRFAIFIYSRALVQSFFRSNFLLINLRYESILKQIQFA